MKTFLQFQEDLSKNVIPLDKKSQENLNKAKKGQIGPGSKGVPQTTFRLQSTNIPMK
jgi:hypothetical protein